MLKLLVSLPSNLIWRKQAPTSLATVQFIYSVMPELRILRIAAHIIVSIYDVNMSEKKKTLYKHDY